MNPAIKIETDLSDNGRIVALEPANLGWSPERMQVRRRGNSRDLIRTIRRLKKKAKKNAQKKQKLIEGLEGLLKELKLN